MNELSSRVALVTGASKGIGAATAMRLAACGAAVGLVGRTQRGEGSLEETLRAIETDGGRAHPIQANLADPEDRARVVPAAREALGEVDILVNCAATTFLMPVTDFPSKRYHLMLDLLVRAPFELSQQLLPSMIERGSGWILNISSRAAAHPIGPPYGALAGRGFTVYGMCKAALDRMSTGMAAEVSHLGVRVNALSPWDNVATPGTDRHGLTDAPLEPPSAMAEAALLLVSSDITGLVTYSTPLLIEHERLPEA